MKTTISIPFEIYLPSSPQDWSLYCSMPGVSVAARELTDALEEALKSGTVERAMAIMHPVHVKFRNFGAMDTEPLVVTSNFIQKFLNQGQPHKSLPYTY